MITYNPGPSQLSEDVRDDIYSITESGLLSISHRSKEFTEITENMIRLLREKFSVPDHFKIVFHHSATGAMESILRNFVSDSSGHVVHGAFSERMLKTAQELALKTEVHDVEWGEEVNVSDIFFSNDVELICLTHNETSTGLMWPEESLKQIRENYKDKLIAWDMTSSFGAVPVSWGNTDIVFCSVQKCLGLPAGLGIVFFDEKLLSLNKNKCIPAWQNFEVMSDKMNVFQTVETPNVFAIALLEKQLSRFNFTSTHEKTLEKYDYLMNESIWEPYISSKNWNSRTVLNLKINHPKKLIDKLNKKDVILGSGYGKLKESCIRIANFPSLKMIHMEKLVDLIKKER